MTGRFLFTSFVFASIALGGCSSRSSGADAGVDAGVTAGPDAGVAAAPTQALPSLPSLDAGKAPPGSYEDETSTRPLELLKFQFTSAIKSRQPVDKMVLAKPGARVYGYLTLRNRSGHARKVHLEFTVNGDKRTEIDLDVAESWSYRTWGYNTVLAKDKTGKLTLVATDDEGHELLSESLPIVK